MTTFLLTRQKTWTEADAENPPGAQFEVVFDGVSCRQLPTFPNSFRTPQIVLTRPTPSQLCHRRHQHTLLHLRSVSISLAPPDLTDEFDQDSSARTDLAFDVLFLSLLSIVSDEAFHKPARHLARMFEMSEGELERLLLEREVRRGDLEMDWLGEGRTKKALCRSQKECGCCWEEERQNGNETKTRTRQPRTKGMGKHRTRTRKCGVSSNCQKLHVSRSNINPNCLPPSSGVLVSLCSFLGCIRLSPIQPQSDCIDRRHTTITTRLTTLLRMDVESAVSLVFLLLPHADLDWQCFLVFLLHFSHFTEMVPRVITPTSSEVALFFVRYPSTHTSSVSGGKERDCSADWVIVSSNDYHLLDEFRPRVHLLSVLTDATDPTKRSSSFVPAPKPSLKQNPTSLFSPSLHTLFHHPSIWEEDGQTTAGARGVETASPDADASVCTI
ncbi:hypothetical protein BLNAU_18130 [Blattamonas nauphoetae]|uniref:Uncharacterized protein n=1 Tax=Blattamonas nauphoetae TaxID=2049346 RepID=A0ABQ9X5I4_9EUKA|nr:hypothetical protein BLNAU_18130 [Blattamonas nauphoetae]